MFLFLSCVHPVPPLPPPAVLVPPSMPSLAFRVRSKDEVHTWVWLDRNATVVLPVVWEDRSPVCWIPAGQGSGWTRLGDCAAPVSADGAWGLVGQLDAVALGMAARKASARGGPVNSAWRAPCGMLLHEQKVSRMRCGTQLWSLPSGAAQAVFDEPGRGLWLILDTGPRLCVISLGEHAEVQVCAPDPAYSG
ncbi:MAG: hypothetical protein ACI9VR_001219 [Cognaticolwellia sp.]